ncbi:DNA replication protein [Cronobacter sakazakii]|nr:DNA replication protein [Cronobacter sakazakii]ELY6389854.1 DNA replication protein [Cronobacter sakazakii]
MSEQLIQAIADKDSQTLSRLANKYQPAQERTAKSVVNTDAERLVDALFRQLKQVFPASAATNLRTEADEAAAKQQWILAFAENGIVRREQLVAGMKRARVSLSPFWPSPGQFIEWCREGEVIQAGLPTVNELVKLVKAYSARRGYYETAEAYPWKHPTHYWMVTFLYSKMRACYWSESELHYYAAEEIKKMFARIKRGEEIPYPCASLPQKNKTSLSKADSLKKIKELRLKHGFLNRNNSQN